jgi:hypothetical protein
MSKGAIIRVRRGGVPKRTARALGSLFLIGIGQQVFQQCGDDQNNDDPDGDAHGLLSVIFSVVPAVLGVTSSPSFYPSPAIGGRAFAGTNTR